MQNEKTLQQMIREYEMNMPPEIMEIINKFDWKRELRTIVMQNQLMADVGTDLEESVYLMLLGVVKVQDVYERMIETHELSQDRVRKVLEEIERKIFDVLHKRLSELEDEEEETVVLKTTAPSIATITTPIKSSESDPKDRDSILAEIEKDEVEEMVVKPNIKTIPEIKLEESKPMSNLGIITPRPIIIEDDGVKITIDNPGVAKPFSFSAEKSTVAQPIKPVITEVVKGIQLDPVASGLNKATIVTPTNTITPPVAPKPAGAPDPYREAIE